MAVIRRFEDMEAWKEARELTKFVYALSAMGPFCKDFELTRQTRRSALSVMSNIAEGFERDGNKEFSHFLGIAKGSCGELRSQLFVALDQGYMNQTDFQTVYREVSKLSRMLSGLIKYLRRSKMRGRKFHVS